MSDLSANCFVQTFKKLEGCKQITVEDVYELFEYDIDLTHNTLFGEYIIGTVPDVVQYENDPDDDAVEVDTAKIPHTEGALKLALRYVEQRLTESSVKLMC